MSRVLIVLGCHRSGTSLIAHSLECLGAKLGSRAKWTGPDNPAAFGEDPDVLGIDQTLMYMASTTWDSTAPIDWGAFEPMIPERFKTNVRNMVLARLSDYPIWAVKEPRMSVLMPFWRPILESIGCEISVVHALRHPMAVARSLQTRNDIPIAAGLDLWLEYTSRARRDVNPDWRSCVVSYEALMTDPMRQIERIGEKIGLRLYQAATARFSREYVDDTLWHETAEDRFPLGEEIGAMWRTASAEAEA